MLGFTVSTSFSLQVYLHQYTVLTSLEVLFLSKLGDGILRVQLVAKIAFPRTDFDIKALCFVLLENEIKLDVLHDDLSPISYRT
jgi:hypothetical protein